MSRGFERVEVVADNADLRFRALHCQPEGQMVEQGQDLALLDVVVLLDVNLPHNPEHCCS